MRRLLHAALESGDPVLRIGDACIRDARPCREHAQKRRRGELGRGYATEPQKVVGPLVRAGERAGSLGQVRNVVEIARQQQVLRRLVLHPVIVEPFARPRACLPDLLDPQLQELAAQPVGEQSVEAEPRSLFVAGHDEEVAPYQLVEKGLRRTGAEDRLAEGAAERLEHRYLQHEREQIPGHQARDLCLEVAPHASGGNRPAARRPRSARPTATAPPAQAPAAIPRRSGRPSPEPRRREAHRTWHSPDAAPRLWSEPGPLRRGSRTPSDRHRSAAPTKRRTRRAPHGSRAASVSRNAAAARLYPVGRRSRNRR